MPLPTDATDAMELVHRIVGYPLAFIVAPIAIATFAGAPGHRWAGRAYATLMTFLYLSGTTLTLTRHPWESWEFARNVAFNLLGFSFVLHGWRAIWLMQRKARQPGAVDVVLLGSLAALVVLVLALALARANAPLHVFAVIGVGLVALEIREWREGLTPAALYRRHVRYMVASYFYVLTVVSLVHLKDELTSDARWLWPAILGLAAMWLASSGARARRVAMRAVLAVSVAFGAYVGWEVVRQDGKVDGMFRVVAAP